MNALMAEITEFDAGLHGVLDRVPDFVMNVLMSRPNRSPYRSCMRFQLK